ncbi:MAG: ABC transporter ATP-binding protein [Candidatus Promineifilaceae bacterium]|nr:ABC transporter ATP-binding protein [Candidatus Promineifilaceae bacterium]
MDVPGFLSLNNVDLVFADDGTQVLSDISLTIDQGAFVAIVGASGIGKSTLLRVLAGLLKPTSGEVLFRDRPAAEAGAPIGIVFQRDNLMPWRTAFENVRLPLELNNEKKAKTNGRVQEMLDLVGLTGFEKSYPAQLSGGMAQRVAIARALIHEPTLLLLDEPFGALDALTRERMGRELLRIWQAMPVTVFMVTHSIEEAVLLADEVLVMGSSKGNGLPATITHHFPITIPRPRQIDARKTQSFLKCESAIREAIQIR